MPSRFARLVSRIALVATVAAGLASCGGWYWRGTRATHLGIRNVYVSGVDAPQLRRALVQALANSGVGMRRRRTQAHAIIELGHEHYERRILSVDPSTGKVREIELQLEAQYTVRAGDGTLIAPQETVSFANDFVFDEASLLGTVEHENLLETDLAEDAARTIILRLETLELPARAPARQP